MLSPLLLFMNSTTENWIGWSVFFKNQPKNNFNIRCRPHYIWTGLIVEAKITNQLEPGLKRPIKLTKENFAESSFTVLNTFAKVYVNETFQSITRKSLFLRNYFLTLQNFIFFFLPTVLIETVSQKWTNMKKKKKKNKALSWQ